MLTLFNENKTCKIRCNKDENGVYMFSVHDFINLVNNKENTNDYGRKLYSRINNLNNISVNTYVFPKGNNKNTPVMNIVNLLTLLLDLPGNMLKRYNILSMDTILIVTQDDKEIIDVIKDTEKN
jgi:hypothetical protein